MNYKICPKKGQDIVFTGAIQWKYQEYEQVSFNKVEYFWIPNLKSYEHRFYLGLCPSNFPG